MELCQTQGQKPDFKLNRVKHKRQNYEKKQTNKDFETRH